MTAYPLYSLVSVLSRILPRGFAYWIGLRMADVFYLLDRKGRAGVCDNLRRVYAHRGETLSERDLCRLARLTFRNFGKYMIDFFRHAALSRDDIARLITLQDEHHLRAAYQRGRGVLVVTAHLGNWEIGGAMLAGLGYPVSAVVLTYDKRKLNELFQRQRARRGYRVIPLGRAVRDIIACVRRGEVVALAADRDFSGDDYRVQIFGAPARMPRGPAWIAAKTGAAVVPSFLMRRPDDTYQARFYPPILPDEAGSPDTIQRRIVDVLEQVIAEYPHQWFIFRNYWRDDEHTGNHGNSHS